MIVDVIIQAIGFVGIGLNILAVQFNKHWQMILIKTLGSLAFVIQYILLKAYTGAAMDAIGIIRNVIFIMCVRKDKPTLIWIILFGVITAVIGGLTWEGIVSLCAITAKVLTTVAYGIKNPHTIRIINFPSSCCWLVYNSLHFSLAGIINEIFVLVSLIIAEIRYYKKDKNEIYLKDTGKDGDGAVNEQEKAEQNQKNISGNPQ